MKKNLVLLAALIMAVAVLLSACGDSEPQEVVNVFNWGENIDESIFDDFEEQTGIKVNYKVYESNEQLYTMLKQGGVNYDVIIPSDYMISRMIDEDMLEKIDYANVPNLSNIDSQYLNLEFDPQQEYSVPYTWGVVGIIYNTKTVTEPVTSWATLFDEKYSGSILQFDNSRDAMATALFYLGYDINTIDKAQLDEAFDLLTKQKPILQGYYMDQQFDKLEGGEAAIGVYYAGDAVTMMSNNPDLAFVVPSEGSNFFVDAMCIPKGAANKANGEAFINFMCEDEIVIRNMEVTGYATPSASAYAILDDELKNNPIIFPDKSILDNCQTYVNLPAETLELYNDYWTKLKS